VGDVILPEHVPATILPVSSCSDTVPTEIPQGGVDLENILHTIEKNLMMKALEKAGGVKTEAARLLGLTFRSFRHRLQKFDKSA
jgi:two-component system response regulator PilR (NtrC family)